MALMDPTHDGEGTEYRNSVDISEKSCRNVGFCSLSDRSFICQMP
jgi:hypothetical protein